MGKQNNRKGKGKTIEATIEEINELYKQGKYRKVLVVIETIEIDKLSNSERGKILLKKAWAHHQLGEYPLSVAIMEKLSNEYKASEEIGSSARYGLAQGLLQLKGEAAFPKVEKILEEIPSSPERDNTLMNYYMKVARAGHKVPVEKIVSIINQYLKMPLTLINGHIINNGSFALYEARNQNREGINYIQLLPDFIEKVIDIYKAVKAQSNHVAAAHYRASKIYEVEGSMKSIEKAITHAKKAVKLWKKLVKSQNGARFAQNLKAAEEQLINLQKKKEEHEEFILDLGRSFVEK